MPKSISEQLIAEIKERADLIEIVSDVVSLKKQGKNYVGLCPFHAEKTPSFSVSPERRAFHCFGCGQGGDVFDFIMQHSGVSFYEAVREVAARCHVELPSRQMSPAERQRMGERERIYKANELARDFFRYCLFKTEEGKKAMDYLGRRNISREMIDAFQIGYAPPAWDRLKVFLHRKGVDPQTARNAGLLIARNSGTGCYDRFRDRVMFPILDGGMRVLGFGGRVMGDGMPKYLNSPESPVFSKRRSLFGLHRAKAPARESGRLFVVEGYFDVVALHQHGIDNAVATLGTALTEEHIRQGFARTVFLVFDADAAGIRAALRGADLFFRWQVDARILSLPQGEDPDSFVFKRGRTAFEELAHRATGIFDFMVKEAMGRLGNSPQGRIQAVKEMSRVLSTVADPLARSVYAKELAELVQVGEATVLQAVQQALAESAERPAAVSSSSENGVGPVGSSQGSGGDAAEPGAHRLELGIIEMLVHCPEVRGDVLKSNTLDLFENRHLAAIGRRILAASGNEDAHVEWVLDSVADPHERRWISAIRRVEAPDWPYDNCLKRLRQFERSRRAVSNRQGVQAVAAAEKAGDENRLRVELSRIQKQTKQIHS